MNNLIKIMCVSVMLSGTALAMDHKYGDRTDKDGSMQVTIVKVGDDRFDLDKFIKDDKLIVQDKNGQKAVFKLERRIGEANSKLDSREEK